MKSFTTLIMTIGFVMMLSGLTGVAMPQTSGRDSHLHRDLKFAAEDNNISRSIIKDVHVKFYELQRPQPAD